MRYEYRNYPLVQVYRGKPHFFRDVLCSRKAKVRGMSLIVCVCDSYTAKESLPLSEPDEFPRGARMPLKPC